MNYSTTRCTTPTATPRTGRGEGMPRGAPYHTAVPFAALPHDVAADPRLTPTDLRVLAALLYYACSKPTCYPSDAGIADRVHKHPGTVRRCLKRLEDLEYIRREFVTATPANPTGRLIYLLFTAPDWSRPRGRQHLDAGAQVPACSHAPRERTPERRCTPAPERRRTPTPCADERAPRAPAPEAPRAQAHAEEDVIVKKNENLEETAGIDSPSRPRPAVPAAPPATPPEAPSAPIPAPTTTSALPFDLRAIGAAPELKPAPTPPARRYPRFGFNLEELTRVATDTADPILAAEIARRTAPPPPPEPPPAMVPTPALLESLPGRHDLIMAMARRLCEETGDFNVATQRTFEQMATAVASRAVPSSVLLSCWRQAMGPKAEHRGKVLVAAWGREVRDYVTPMRR
ncbi:MAG: helix-turn-helix domain-containing protein [Planctomycetaceae bacterium]|nr:helix-turn-helix domain-containing protein [Planctomycetaceae bacterium]